MNDTTGKPYIDTRENRLKPKVVYIALCLNYA